MNRYIMLTGFAVVFSISFFATMNPILFGFITHIPHGDKLAHFILFGMLGLLAVLQAWRFGSVYVCCGIALVIGYAITDELMQQFLATRSFSLIDLVANISGVIIFSATAILYAQWRDRVALDRKTESVSKSLGSSRASQLQNPRFMLRRWIHQPRTTDCVQALASSR